MPLRCAVYTRKSTEHNLDLAFNSLDELDRAARHETGCTAAQDDGQASREKSTGCLDY